MVLCGGHGGFVGHVAVVARRVTSVAVMCLCYHERYLYTCSSVSAAGAAVAVHNDIK